MVRARVVDTAVGRVILEATGGGIVGVERVGPRVSIPGDDDPISHRTHPTDPAHSSAAANPDAADRHLTTLADQIHAYLAGELRHIDVPVDWVGAGVHDPFSREVYLAIQRIPYGQTSTYGQISVEAGRPRNARRVGRLCSLVPASFVIPVHRVIRADGGLGNCPEFRRHLIEHEHRNLTAGHPVEL